MEKLLKNDSGFGADRIRKEFEDTYTDNRGIIRWMNNQQIPFDDMLADFRTLELIDENVQLTSNMVREAENDAFWKGYFRNAV
jgi:hypothetical protein